MTGGRGRLLPGVVRLRGRVGDLDEGLAALLGSQFDAAELLAGRVEADPDAASLWREYRLMLDSIVRVVERWLADLRRSGGDSGGSESVSVRLMEVVRDAGG